MQDFSTADIVTVIGSMRFEPLSLTLDEFDAWVTSNGWEGESDPGKLSMSVAEQRWVALAAVVAQIEDDATSETVSSEHILAGLRDNGFCQAFEGQIERTCEGVWGYYSKDDDLVPATRSMR